MSALVGSLPADVSGLSHVQRGGHVASSIVVGETVGLAAIFEPHVNAVVLRRALDRSCLADYCRRIAETPFSFKATLAFDGRSGMDALDELARWLPAEDARDVLLNDVAYGVEVLSEMSGSARIGVRLVTMQRPMCPAFHMDHVTLRWLCTYAGPSTEWLDERDVDRAFLLVHGAQHLPRAIVGGATVCSCHALDVLVLKGTGWDGNEGRGVVHRSPVGTSPRLLLTLDPIG